MNAMPPLPESLNGEHANVLKWIRHTGKYLFYSHNERVLEDFYLWLADTVGKGQPLDGALGDLFASHVARRVR